MRHSILSENQKRRLDLPLWMLICFSMFCVWQMGFIYFMGPSLVLDGRTPLPIDMDNVTMLIALGYVLAIIYMIAVPHLVVWAARITTVAALVSVVGLFLPLSGQQITMLLYIQTFCCCFMIGFETFTISNLFSEHSTVVHLTAAYAVAMILISVVQNDLFPVTFPVFRVLTLLMLALMLVFFFRLPAGRADCPRYVKKKDGLRSPKHLFWGIFIYSFVADIMMLAGPAAVTEVPNGVFVAYLAGAVGSLILYGLYRRKKMHPMNAVSVFMALSVTGFLFLFLSTYVPALTYPACVLLGFGFMPCWMMPLYGMTLMKSYPSRLVVPGIMGVALITVLVQSALVEAFRDMPNMLHLAYLSITVICIMIYWNLAPYLVHTFQRKIVPAKTEESTTPGDAVQPVESAASHPLLSQLTPRELEVLELIGGGYSNRDIAGILVISEHTVNDYTKKIYRKLDVHSRHAAAQIINRATVTE